MNCFNSTSRILLVAALLVAGNWSVRAQGIGVGTTTPAAAAALDVTSTTQGLLLPRMTAAQRAAIASPPQSLIVFQTDGTPGMYYYIGNSWVSMASGLIPDANGTAGPSPALRVTTLAGSGITGATNGTGTAAQFSTPGGLALDASGNLFVADRSNQCIRQIVVATGVVTTLAGSTIGSANGTGTAAQFNTPSGVASDNSGNLYVADQNNNLIRKIVVATGVVTTLAGSGTSGFADGTGLAAQFNSPAGVVTDGSGNLYVADQSNNCIRKIVVATGVVTTLAGSGTSGFADGTGPAAQFRLPTGITIDASGNLYVTDQSNNRIRKIVVTTGVVTTLAGSGAAGNFDGTAAQFHNPAGIVADGSGNLYVADQSNYRIRKIVVATGVVSTLAGSTPGSADGTAAGAQFNYPYGVTVDASGTVYVGDTFNQRIRIIK